MVWIDGDPSRAPERFNRERRTGAYHFNLLVFGFTVGVNAQINRHAEQIEILRNFAGDAKARRFAFFGCLRGSSGPAQAEGGVLHLEFGRTGGIEPLREE